MMTKTTENNYLGSLIVLAVLAVVAAMLPTASPVYASTTFTVNSTGDQLDATINGMCDVDLATQGKQCTLRAAIEEANDTPGADAIHFNIPGTGVRTITPGSGLPDLTEQVTIDGYTQPGASPNTLTKGTNAVLMIELNGSNAGPHSGLATISSGVVVRGLVINRFGGEAITMDEATGTRVEGNFIGTDPSGTVALGNATNGVAMFFASNNRVGGASLAARNLISGNDFDGVLIDPASDNNKVLSNLIGTKKDGVTALRNFGDGVDISGDSNTVGGDTTASANTVAFSSEDGVTVEDGTGNRILRNSIVSNGEEGIDLGLDGPTANDSGDSDVGANNLQNMPSLGSARNVSGKTTVKGTLNSRPGATYTIQFFSNPKGTNQGRTFIGQKTSLNVDGSGHTSFTFSPSNKVALGQTITATATNEFTGDTSEFSAAKGVIAG